MLSNPPSPIHRAAPTTRTQSPHRLPPRSPPPIAPHLLDPELGDKPVKHESITFIDANPAKHQLPEPVPFSYSSSPHPVEHRWAPPPPPLHLSFTPAVFAVPYEFNMPHRVEDRSSRRSDDRAFESSQPTLDHSPVPSVTSLAHSSVSTPSPPLSAPPGQYYQHPSYTYNPPPPPPGRYADGTVPHPSHHGSHPYVPSNGPATTRAIKPAYVPTQEYPGTANYVIHTDDASTKLSDRVRRKCFNCRTTDTSTWRRSSLTPGKVLCNKCGLFERTHSRPRPEQFPHKRGPIVTTSFKSTRDPPPSHGRVSSLPQASQVIQSHAPPVVPPHQYDHPSIAPLVNRQDSQSSHMSHAGRVNSIHGGHSPGGTPPELRNILNGPPDHQQVNGQALENGHGVRTSSTRTTPHQSPKVEQRTPPQI
ncbi:hypothetical protein QCA50_013550 [Cerrena zonata]|uniref:GATA-type domain-containing protein n=1 Tax=Cerrena zonata TaxID=2478898 RepID=A0AAW0FNM5_9APHY